MSRKRKVISGFALKTVYMVLNVALAFFMMPFILHSLGDRMYGIWILVGAIMGYSSYLDLGLSSAVGRFVSRAVGRGDTDEVNEIVNTSFVLFFVIGCVAAVVTIVIAALAGRFVSSVEEVRVLQVLIMLLGFNIAVGFPCRAFGAVLSANLRYGITEGVELAGLLLRNGLILALFSMGYGIIALGLIVFGVSVATYALHVSFALGTGGLRVDLKRFNGARVRELFSYSVYSFIYRLAEVLIFRVDSIVVAAFVGVAAVAHYSIASTLISYIIYFVYNAFALSGPVYSQDEGRGDEEGIRRKFLLTTRVAVYMTAFIAGMAVFYGDEFIARWMGEAYLDAYAPLVILMTASLAFLMQMPSNTVLYNISRHKFLAYSGVVEGVANLALSLYLVRDYGMAGVAIGTAIPMVGIRLFVQPLYVCSVLKISAPGYYLGTLGLPLLVCAIAIVPAYILLGGFARPDYPVLAALAAAHLAVYGAVVVAFGFSSSDRRYLLDWFGGSRGGRLTTA